MKIRLKRADAQKLCADPLRLKGENLTHRGAKLIWGGKGWWAVYGYAYDGSDLPTLG